MLPCLPSMVPVARRFARGLMPDCPRLDDAELLLSELVTNAVAYGGGDLTVRVTAGAGRARVEITDSGPSPAAQTGSRDLRDAEQAEQAGRGLRVVNALADRWGYDRGVDGQATLWAELTW